MRVTELEKRGAAFNAQIPRHGQAFQTDFGSNDAVSYREDSRSAREKLTTGAESIERGLIQKI